MIFYSDKTNEKLIIIISFVKQSMTELLIKSQLSVNLSNNNQC